MATFRGDCVENPLASEAKDDSIVFTKSATCIHPRVRAKALVEGGVEEGGWSSPRRVD